jgi:tetratricopeptide (TPR) repeat protein
MDCFYDLETALKLNSSHAEANMLMEKLKITADNLRNAGLVLSLNNRVADALNKLNVAITFNPRMAEYYLQRGILQKRLKDFNSAIDDFLMGLEKNQQSQVKDQVLYQNFQRQILLTYNDFALQCIQKGNETLFNKILFSFLIN